MGLDVCEMLTDLQKCPFDAIEIINLPKDLDKDTTHRYGPNTFKLHRSVHKLSPPMAQLSRIMCSVVCRYTLVFQILCC